VLRNDPEHVEARILSGRIYQRLGNTADAVDEWKWVLRMNPHHMDSDELREYIGRWSN
jgi:lipopolysaccharide biosynthesis regulator YciM